MDGNAIIAKVWNEIVKGERNREAAAAIADPVKHRLSRVIEGHLGYSYATAGMNGLKQPVRFCASTNKNVAGYFLIWRQTYVNGGKRVVRDQWDSTTSKRLALRLMQRLADEHRKKYQK